MNLPEITDALLRDFEAKAVEFASTYPKSDLKDFDIPIRTLRQFTPYFNKPENIERCDKALHDLATKIPEYARSVPKRAFCLWEGGEISQKHLSNLAKFLKLNPDYDLTLLTSQRKKIIDALMKRFDGKWLMNSLKVETQDYSGNPLLESAINQENNGPFANHAAASDIARLYALVKKDEAGNSGGLYFDVDCEFHQPLPQLIAPFGIQTLWPEGSFLNGMIAAAPDCDILDKVIKNTVAEYDDRARGFKWSADLWVNKRAGIILPTDDPALDNAKGKGRARKSQTQNYADQLVKDIAYSESTGYQAWADFLKSSRNELLQNPRQGLTEKFTVDPLWNVLKANFSYLASKYSRTLNALGGLMGPGKVFELPFDKGWAERPAHASKRRASIA